MPTSRARFVGITGSTGKTSTKDILAALCAPVARTVASEGSYNAELGVPLTLGRLEPDTEICLVEMGMRGFGQIAELCEIARPDIGVITRRRAGPPRARRLGGRGRALEGGARGRAARRRDRRRAPVGGPRPASAGRHRDPPGRARRRRAPRATVRTWRSAAAGSRFPFTSRHQAQNALTALTAYDALGLPLDRLAESAAAVSSRRGAGRSSRSPAAGS